MKSCPSKCGCRVVYLLLNIVCYGMGMLFFFRHVTRMREFANGISSPLPTICAVLLATNIPCVVFTIVIILNITLLGVFLKGKVRKSTFLLVISPLVIVNATLMLVQFATIPADIVIPQLYFYCCPRFSDVAISVTIAITAGAVLSCIRTHDDDN